MIKKHIKDVPVGTTIKWDNRFWVKLPDFSGACTIGCEKLQKEYVWGRQSNNFSLMTREFPLRKEFDHIQYFYWINQLVAVYLEEDEILFSNQICIGCNLPAPHIAPNVGDKFICTSCKFLQTLDVVPASG